MANRRNKQVQKSPVFDHCLILSISWRLAVPLLAYLVWVEWRDEWELLGKGIYMTIKEAGNWWLGGLYSDQ